MLLEPLSGYLRLGTLMLENKEKYSVGWNFGPSDTDKLSVEDILKLCLKYWNKGSIQVDNLEHPLEANLLKLDVSKVKSYLNWYPVYNANQVVEKQ